MLKYVRIMSDICFKMSRGWAGYSSGKVLAEHAQVPGFTPQNHRSNNKSKFRAEWVETQMKHCCSQVSNCWSWVKRLIAFRAPPLCAFENVHNKEVKYYNLELCETSMKEGVGCQGQTRALSMLQKHCTTELYPKLPMFVFEC